MCEVAVPNAHSVKAFGIRDMDKADTTGNEYAIDRVQQVEEFLPLRCSMTSMSNTASSDPSSRRARNSATSPSSACEMPSRWASSICCCEVSIPAIGYIRHETESTGTRRGRSQDRRCAIRDLAEDNARSDGLGRPCAGGTTLPACLSIHLDVPLDRWRHTHRIGASSMSRACLP